MPLSWAADRNRKEGRRRRKSGKIKVVEEKKGPPDAGRLLNTREGGGRKESGGIVGVGGSARFRKALIDRGHTQLRFPWEFWAVGG